MCGWKGEPLSKGPADPHSVWFSPFYHRPNQTYPWVLSSVSLFFLPPEIPLRFL